MANLTGYAWSQKVSVTGNKPASSLAYFPGYVRFATSTELNDYTLNSGLDIAFTLDGDSTPLPYQREYWTDNGANVDAGFWVRVPSVGSASDTDLRIYIGKTGGTAYTPVSDVWNENGAGNFKGVWHFNELAGWVAGGADYIKDSAGTNHGRAYNDVDAGEGMVDGGAAFGITFDEVDAPDSSSLRLTGNITLSAWVKPTGNGGSYPQIAGRDYLKEYSLRLWSNTRVPFISVKNTHVKATGSIAANAWSHVLVSYDGSNASFFINGVAAGTPALTAIPDGGNEIFRIGSRAASFPFNGNLDEVRVAATTRTVAWVLFEVNNIADYAGTITHGAWEDSVLPLPTGLTASDGTYADKIALTWDAYPTADTFEVWRSETDEIGTATKFADGILTSAYNDTVDDITTFADVTYYYWVLAVVSGTPSGYSASDSGYAFIPTLPTGLTASDGTYDTKIALAWDAYPTADTFEVWRALTNNINNANLLVEDLVTNSYDDMVNGSTTLLHIIYYYWVVAVVDSIKSDYSSNDSGYAGEIIPSECDEEEVTTNTSVTFEIVDTVFEIELPAPILGDSEIIDLKTYFNMAMSGLVYSHIKTEPVSKMHMTFSSLSWTKKNSLLDFINEAMGELTDMVYYDGITLRGYFVNDPTVIKNRSSSLYEVTIDFEGDRL